MRLSSLQRHGYTFVEMLVVSAIVALVGALVIPKISATSRRMTVESSLSALRGAFNECAMRARAGGKALQLVLDAEGKSFTVRESSNELDHDWRPSVLSIKGGGEEESESGEVHSASKGILGGESTYEVPADIVWEELPESNDDEGGYVFSFFPDGEAAGPELAFSLKGERYRIIVDRVIGRATVVFDER